MTTEEKLILLLSKQNINPDAQKEISSIIDSHKINWPIFVKLASLHKIENYIYSNLRNNGLSNILPEKIEKYFKSIYYQVSVRNIQYKKLVENISSSCYKKKILLVKGTSLIYDFYQDFGARRLADVDILVKKDDRDEIWNALLNNGWNSDNWPGFKSQLHASIYDAQYKTMHYLYYGKEEDSLFIDIHWKFYIGEEADNVAEYAIESSKKISNNIYVYSNEMQLVHLCCNNYTDYTQDGVMYLRNICDVNELLLNREINWNRVELICKKGEPCNFIKKALTYTLSIISTLYNTNIPAQYKDNLFSNIEITPTTILRLPVTKSKSGIWKTFYKKLSILDSPIKVVIFLYKEIFPDKQWLNGMYNNRKYPLIAYWSYMLRRHLLHKKIRYQE